MMQPVMVRPIINENLEKKKHTNKLKKFNKIFGRYLLLRLDFNVTDN